MPRHGTCIGCGGQTSGSRSGACGACHDAVRAGLGSHPKPDDIRAAVLRANGRSHDEPSPEVPYIGPRPVEPEFGNFATRNWGRRHLAIDIETSGGLNGSFGRVLCIGTLLEGEDKPYVIDAFKYGDEVRAFAELDSIWKKADCLVTFNGRRFDWRFINARRLRWHLEVLAPKDHYDLYDPAKKVRTYNHRLATLCEHLEVESGGKTHVDPERWVQAAAGDREAYDEIAAYCAQDVLVLPEVMYYCRALLTAPKFQRA